MKRFFAVILILGAGGACFFLGWAQFSVPAGSYGVIRSKTHGTDMNVVRSGEFRWVWYKLIPKNAEVAVFKPSGDAVSVNISGTLPSAAAYALFAGVTADFSYNIEGEVFCSLKGESLPALAETWNMAGQDDLDAYERRAAEDIRNFVSRKIRAAAENEDALEAALVTGTVPGLETELAAAFPDRENWQVSVKTVRVPDLALYNDIKSLYTDYRDAQKRLFETELSAAASRNLSSRMRFDELSLYGELLTKYPVLLDYLALEKGIAPPR